MIIELNRRFGACCIASLRHNAALEGGGGDVHKKYSEDVKAGRGGHEHFEDGLPDHIKKGSIEETKWRRSHPNNKKVKNFVGLFCFRRLVNSS